ncbi:MAG TPA: efflux RND transporter periplasmic adaptor subunit [Usitatibacteraceae bacterium]|nr:efflux RND transporter periplasmic adaptor subunit [Usitatibacteraceae bacterium]
MPRSAFRLLAPLSAAFIAAACGPQGGPPPGGFPPAVVAVKVVKPAAAPVEFEFPAQTAGSREVEVRARVTGILLKRNYEEGARVRAGQSLFTIDPASFEAAVARAQADVAGAEAGLAQASRNAKRLKPLVEAKAVSQKDYDDAVSAEEIAAAGLQSARTRLADARLNLSWTRVESPIAGVTSRALRSEGSLVSGPDVLLTTVTQSDPLYVNFGLSEAEQSRFTREAAAGTLAMPRDGHFEVALRLEDGTAYAKSGRLVFSDERYSAATGTADARAEVPNPQGLLRPGQFVRVILKGATRPNAITVPQRAVLEGPQGKIVYVVGAQGKAEPRPVGVGDWTGADWIITSGLTAGDQVIVDGLMKVFPGGPVQVGDPNAPPPGAPGAAPAPKADAKPDAKK